MPDSVPTTIRSQEEFILNAQAAQRDRAGAATHRPGQEGRLLSPGSQGRGEYKRDAYLWRRERAASLLKA